MNLPTDLIQTFVIILVVIIITSLMVRLIAKILNKFERFKEDMTIVYLVRDIINYTIYFISLMIILQLFGINLYATLLSLGIVGIAVSLAAKDLISNFLSGIILIVGKIIKVGDTIEINKTKGVIEIIHLRTTTIRNDDGVIITIANSILTNNLFKLYKSPEKYRIDINVGLPLNIDLEDFNEYIIGKIKKIDGVLTNPQPRIFAREITFKQTKIKISFWIKDFNNKDDYKSIITNEVRKYVNQ